LTIASSGNARVFTVATGASAIISDLTITGGSADNGAGIFNAGALEIHHCLLVGNSASIDGGGIYNSGTLTLTNTTLTAIRPASAAAESTARAAR